jgi:hypothetical protein
VVHWIDDDFWDDRREPDLEQVPVEKELEGSVYMIPDQLWGFHAKGRQDHPGACVHCDLSARLSFLNKGTDLHSARLDRFALVIVESSTNNGLAKPTAFALDPRRMRLHKLLTFHEGKEWLGRLEEEHFRVMREHFEMLARLGGRADP